MDRSVWRSALFRVRDHFASLENEDVENVRSLDLLFHSAKNLPFGLLSRWVGHRHIEGSESLGMAWGRPDWNEPESYQPSSSYFPDARGGVCGVGPLWRPEEAPTRLKRFRGIATIASGLIREQVERLRQCLDASVFPTPGVDFFYPHVLDSAWLHALMAFALRHGEDYGIQFVSGMHIPTTPFVMRTYHSSTGICEQTACDEAIERLIVQSPAFATNEHLSEVRQHIADFGRDRFHLMFGGPRVSTIFVDWLLDAFSNTTAGRQAEVGNDTQPTCLIERPAELPVDQQNESDSENSPGKADEIPDGPIKTNGFRWKGKVHRMQPLQPVPYAVLCKAYRHPLRTLSMPDIDRVRLDCGTRGAKNPTRWDNVETIRTRINAWLTLERLPMSICLNFARKTVELQIKEE